MENIPLLSVDLINELDEMIPEKCPTIGQREREIFWYAGQRDLVRTLKEKLKDQDDNLTLKL